MKYRGYVLSAQLSRSRGTIASPSDLYVHVPTPSEKPSEALSIFYRGANDPGSLIGNPNLE